MLPNGERDTLPNTIFDATDWAKAGIPAIGFDLLLLGQRRAEQGRAAGAPWGEELVNCYRRVLDGYERRYDGRASKHDPGQRGRRDGRSGARRNSTSATGWALRVAATFAAG